MNKSKYSYLLLFVLDCIVGTFIGLASFWFKMSSTAVKEFPEYRLLPYVGMIQSFKDSGSFLLFTLPLFFSTATLTPFLISFLVKIKEKPVRKYYFTSALSGVLFGMIACSFTGLYMGLVAIAAPQLHSVTPGAASPFSMMFLIGLTCPIIFFDHILIGGAVFGVLNGFLARCFKLRVQ